MTDPNLLQEVPEKFWVKQEDGTYEVDVLKLAKSYTKLEKAFGSRMADEEKLIHEIAGIAVDIIEGYWPTIDDSLDPVERQRVMIERGIEKSKLVKAIQQAIKEIREIKQDSV